MEIENTGTSKSIERHIVIGLIVSTEFISQVEQFWDDDYIGAEMALRISSWCFEYYKIYKKAPFRDIEGIYIQKVREGLPKDIAEEIEEDILPSLSDEYEREGKFNSQYLLDRALKYFKERRLQIHSEEIQLLVDKGQLEEAEELATQFVPAEDYSFNAGLIKGGVLISEKIKPLNWLIKDLIPRGLTILGGRSKVGKSYFMLKLSLALAQGKKVFNEFGAGFKPKTGQILYLSLEDPIIRIQSRMKELCTKPNKTLLDQNLTISFQWEKLTKGGLNQIRTWIDEQKNPMLIVIDTIARVWNKKSTTGGGGTYAEEYSIYGPLADLAHEYNLSIILVTHTTKSNKTSDPFDQILGGMGTQAPADNLIVLCNEEGRTDKKIFSIRGKDIEEKHLSFEASGSYWEYRGEAKEVQKTAERQILCDLIAKSSKPLSVKEIKEIIKNEKLPISQNSVQIILGKLSGDGQLEQPKYGKYAISGYIEKSIHRKMPKKMNRGKK